MSISKKKKSMLKSMVKSNEVAKKLKKNHQERNQYQKERRNEWSEDEAVRHFRRAKTVDSF